MKSRHLNAEPSQARKQVNRQKAQSVPEQWWSLKPLKESRACNGGQLGGALGQLACGSQAT